MLEVLYNIVFKGFELFLGRSAALVGGGTVTIATDFNPIWAQVIERKILNGKIYKHGLAS